MKISHVVRKIGTDIALTNGIYQLSMFLVYLIGTDGKLASVSEHLLRGTFHYAIKDFVLIFPVRRVFKFFVRSHLIHDLDESFVPWFANAASCFLGRNQVVLYPCLVRCCLAESLRNNCRLVEFQPKTKMDKGVDEP